MRDHLRTRHYSIRTETAYVDWARRFILFHGKRHPQEMGAAEVEAFLTYLAVQRQVSASTQNQAKAAILYLYKQVLGVDLPWLDDVVQAKTPRRLPVRAAPQRPNFWIVCVTICARAITAFAPKRLMWRGRGALFCFAESATRKRWVRRR